MTFQELRRALQAIVLAGLPAAAAPLGGCGDGDPCSETYLKTYHLSPPHDPPLYLRIESCRADVDACQALCKMAMERAGVNTTSPISCEVEFEGDRTDVTVAYVLETYVDGCAVDGRRPPGLLAQGRTLARDRAGAWLARAAWLEAASIHAFVHLAGELEHHGAPPALVRWALASAADEVRHTEMMSSLALRRGARPEAPQVVRPGHRSLVAMAIENAIEGCVRETWGAALAAWQSRTARDPDVRAAFGAIARDELRHAALAWAIDRWLAPRLDVATRAQVLAARDHAAHALHDELPRHPDDSLVALGLPDPAQGRALLADAHRTLWTGGPS